MIESRSPYQTRPLLRKPLLVQTETAECLARLAQRLGYIVPYGFQAGEGDAAALLEALTQDGVENLALVLEAYRRNHTPWQLVALEINGTPQVLEPG